jgi:hypothetical protein
MCVLERKFRGSYAFLITIEIKMKICLLLQNGMRPLPNNIKIVANWGNLMIVEDGKYITGEHLLLEGDIKSFKDWLSSFVGVWVGIGQPVEQEFEFTTINM